MNTPIATEVIPTSIIVRDTGTTYAPNAELNINEITTIHEAHIVYEPHTQHISMRRKHIWISYIYIIYICISLLIISRYDIMWKLYWLAYIVTILDIWVNIHLIIYYFLTIVQFIICFILVSQSSYSKVWIIILFQIQLIWCIIKIIDIIYTP